MLSWQKYVCILFRGCCGCSGLYCLVPSTITISHAVGSLSVSLGDEIFAKKDGLAAGGGANDKQHREKKKGKKSRQYEIRTNTKNDAVVELGYEMLLEILLLLSWREQAIRAHLRTVGQPLLQPWVLLCA